MTLKTALQRGGLLATGCLLLSTPQGVSVCGRNSQHGLAGFRLSQSLREAQHRKKRAEPYTKIVEALPEMWRHTMDIAKKALGEDRRAYVLVNNLSEGTPPVTIQSLRRALASAQT